MIKGRLVLKGKISLKSPLLIGSGTSEVTDIDILTDAQGRPYIPATSFVGVLRSSIRPDGVNTDRLWGYTTKTDSIQSNLRCDDLVTDENSECHIEIRDGIKIDPKTGLVKEGAKYDYEVVPKGIGFNLHMEAVYVNDEDKMTLLKMLKTIGHQLSRGAISVGAKTNSGLGRLRLREYKIYDFDFSNKSDVLRWLREDYSTHLDGNSIEPFELRANDFTINMTLRLKTSLIVRSYSSSPDDPDTVHITSGKDYIIPGTSLKGVVRARAEKITKTMKGNGELTDNLFGYVYDDQKEAQDKGKQKGGAKKGRITIDEVTLANLALEMQTRIKIDRFTGGTIESALLETMPLFATNKDEQIKDVTIHIKQYNDYEAGLMLLVLKDLWTGDLAVGGDKSIGRGVFEGIMANITIGDETITIGKDLAKLSVKERQTLEALVKAFVDYKNGGAR